MALPTESILGIGRPWGGILPQPNGVEEVVDSGQLVGVPLLAIGELEAGTSSIVAELGAVGFTQASNIVDAGASVIEAATGTLLFLLSIPESELPCGASRIQADVGALEIVTETNILWSEPSSVAAAVESLSFSVSAKKPRFIGCYLYTVGMIVVPPIVAEEEDMLDFEDIGGVYGSTNGAVMAANVAAVNAYFSAVARPALTFAGPRNVNYLNKRVPGTAYFNGTLVIPDQKPVLLDGGNSILDFRTIVGNTPAIALGTGGAGMERVVRDFQLTSTGSGIRCDAPGRGTVLQRIRIYPQCAYSSSLNHDGWTDRDTAGYGVQILDGGSAWTPDGITIEGVQIFDSGGHGFFICDQLNAGTIRGRCHNAAGSGFKAENMNGVDVDVVSEHNYSWGYHLHNCGMGRYSGGLSGGDTDRPSDVKSWLESNNWRGSAYKVTGHGIRQAKVTASGAIRFRGHDGWASNKIDVDEGSRNSCIFESSRHVTQSFAPVVQITTGSHVLPSETSLSSSHNFAAVWSNAALRPIVEQVGDEFVITYPAGCFQGAIGGPAYWRPWGTASLFTSEAGDVAIFECEISGDANLVAWCVGRETISPQRQLSNCCEFHVAPVSGGRVWPGVYNSRRRKLMGRVALGEIRTDVTPSIVLWANGYQDQAGTYPQSQPLALTIHTWKFYVHRADGSAL